MTNPISWHRASFGCEIARLGVVDVGAIQPQGDGPSYWVWRLFLPMCRAGWSRADNVEHARERVITGIGDWLAAAELEPRRGRAS